ncbi:MAG TPA: NAD(P)/FAD-dependent oxidoreductase [Sphingomicrobium sp.]|nr:NAD(P)/FAD-dependent oxidoreductase [Sphingomicrobium sp.]
MKELVIIGGGAAGIGAASEARASGIDALILEAKSRLGGRAHSIDWNGHRLDLGCTWMHSAERNSLRAEAERIGAEIYRRPTNWFGQYRDLGWSRDEQKDALAAFEQLEKRMNDRPPPSDRASDAVDPGNPWRAWLDAVSGYINGAPLADVSVEDWLAYDNAASSLNLRLLRGYGELLASLGAGVNCQLNTPVKAVRRLKDSVQLETVDGVIEAENVLITVPTATLTKIWFDPPIEDVFEAAAQLPLGIADKLFLELDEADAFPNDAHLLGNPRSSQTGSYFIRPMGMPVVEGFFGGEGARAIEQLGDEGAFAFAIEELVALLGSGLRKRLRPLILSRWAQDPWIGGSYSHARPGHAAARNQLANAGDERVHFAGEAVSRSDYSTAHGAYDSGVAAVRKIAESRH